MFQVFEYGQIVRDIVDIHYPVHEMTCNSKISCISWSQYHKGMLASSDYEGIVTIWDAFTGTQTQNFQVKFVNSVNHVVHFRVLVAIFYTGI